MLIMKPIMKIIGKSPGGVRAPIGAQWSTRICLTVGRKLLLFFKLPFSPPYAIRNKKFVTVLKWIKKGKHINVAKHLDMFNSTTLTISSIDYAYYEHDQTTKIGNIGKQIGKRTLEIKIFTNCVLCILHFY